MKTASIMAMVIAAVTSSTAAAQQAERPAARGAYFAGGVQAGGEFEICDEDDDCSEGGYGAFGRLGYRANRVLGVEAEVGAAALGGDEAFFHAVGLGVLTLPAGPVDFRVRAGGGVFSADEETRAGFAFGPGVGFRPDDRSAIRADILILTSDDPDADTGFDLGGFFQIGYERRF